MNNDQRKIIVDTFHGVCGMILLSFAKHHCDQKDQILRNFVARTDVMLKGIFTLWSTGDTQTCWIIFRCLLERLFHIHYISENNEFEKFDDWSFFQQCNANNRIASDIKYKDKTETEFLNLSESDKERYKNLAASPPKWRRPDPEKVAKEMELSFLYKFGYDYSSTHVHPMANDGLEDFYNITKLEPKPNFPDNTVAFNNSVLVASLIIQEILNSSNFRWRTVVYSFFENVRITLKDSERIEYQIDFLKLSQIFKQHSLCEKIE